MIFLLLSGIILLSLTIYFYYKFRQSQKDLKAVVFEVKNSHEHPNRTLTYGTSDKNIQELLNSFNTFVEDHRQFQKEFNQLDSAMKNTTTNLSHDLKTPLTVISGYTEVLKSNLAELDQGEISQKLDKIGRQADKLTKTINGYFDLNKLQAGEMKLTNEKLDLVELLREEILSYYEKIDSLQLELVLELPEETIFVLGDKLAFHRIFGNLISNAIKYGEAGHYLSIKVWQTTEQVLVEVMDKGKGIMEENQEKIFERMITLEDATDKNYSGSGLGLAITKKLVESMQGKITVYSQPYVRTSFTVKFPKTR
ncbi:MULTISPECIES: ATP-binding protein [Enterococcus]|uniref:sensor histidine kinase n=1 Tax=Enterococcus sp. AZ103 TaxID=2774628 RepID=UPI003F202D6C